MDGLIGLYVRRGRPAQRRGLSDPTPSDHRGVARCSLTNPVTSRHGSIGQLVSSSCAPHDALYRQFGLARDERDAQRRAGTEDFYQASASALIHYLSGEDDARKSAAASRYLDLGQRKRSLRSEYVSDGPAGVVMRWRAGAALRYRGADLPRSIGVSHVLRRGLRLSAEYLQVLESALEVRLKLRRVVALQLGLLVLSVFVAMVVITHAMMPDQMWIPAANGGDEPPPVYLNPSSAKPVGRPLLLRRVRHDQDECVHQASRGLGSARSACFWLYWH